MPDKASTTLGTVSLKADGDFFFLFPGFQLTGNGLSPSTDLARISQFTNNDSVFQILGKLPLTLVTVIALQGVDDVIKGSWNKRLANYLSLFSMNLTAVKISAMVVRHLGSYSIGPYLNSTAVYTVHCECVCSGFYQWYQWYTNIVQGSTNGTIGKTIDTNGNANGTTGSPNGTIGTIGKNRANVYHRCCCCFLEFPGLLFGTPSYYGKRDVNG